MEITRIRDTCKIRRDTQVRYFPFFSGYYTTLDYNRIVKLFYLLTKVSNTVPPPPQKKNHQRAGVCKLLDNIHNFPWRTCKNMPRNSYVLWGNEFKLKYLRSPSQKLDYPWKKNVKLSLKSESFLKVCWWILIELSWWGCWIFTKQIFTDSQGIYDGFEDISRIRWIKAEKKREKRERDIFFKESMRKMWWVNSSKINQVFFLCEFSWKVFSIYIILHF